MNHVRIDIKVTIEPEKDVHVNRAFRGD
jgi:hypothetical protein